MNSIFTRRSIRKYEDKEIEKDKIEKLLRAAMQAPSAGNQQPWEFIVVENKESLEELAQMSPYSKVIADSKVAIVLLANKERMKFPENWQQDMAAATQNLLLEIVELGLGGVWLGVAPLEDRMNHIQKMFDLPANILPFSVVPVGYSSAENKFVDRYDETRVHNDKW